LHYLLNDASNKGQYSGPFSMAELMEMARRGKFTGAELVWQLRDDKWQWVEAKSVDEFIQMFNALEHEAVTEAKAESAEIRLGINTGMRRPTTIIAFGGGKGGSGKTSLTVGLGLCLAAAGKTVILVDGDLGGANLNTALGSPEAKHTSVDFFIRRDVAVKDLFVPTRFKNLHFISGQGGVLGLANPRYSQKLKFINQLKRLDAEFVLLDLGAGTTYDTLDFFLASDRGVLVTSPDPLSINKAYGFLKAAVYRNIARLCSDDAVVSSHIEQMAARAFRPTIGQFLSGLKAESPESCAFVRKRLHEQPIGLILNMVMHHGEVMDAHKLIGDISRNIGIAVDFLGSVAFDPSVRLSIRKQVPFVIDRPKSIASQDVLKIALEKLLPQRNVMMRTMRREAVHRLKKLKNGK
jgi:flagellar biosynthesis protein FlhG